LNPAYGSNRILVVDDDHALLGMVEESIGDCYDVVLARSGKQALEILEGGIAPELILLDIDMPDMDGFETLNRIREMEAFSDTPVIFLTGVTGSEAELTVLRLGAQDYITKPFVRDNLLARIRLRLESGLQARQLRETRKRLDDAGAESKKSEKKFAALTKGLTPAEKSVARLILQRHSNQEIAQWLGYSPGYVKNLVTSIYGKLGVHGRRELLVCYRDTNVDA
jgi:DNA-binding NarL/FixJ family response regulator